MTPLSHLIRIRSAGLRDRIYKSGPPNLDYNAMWVILGEFRKRNNAEKVQGINTLNQT